MKTALLVIGILLVLFGIHWIGQGTGWFPWPGNPQMTGHSVWITMGGGAIVAGGLLGWFSRR